MMLTNGGDLGKRDDRIDSLKYWLMVLVIAGHVFSQEQFSSNSICTVVWQWIYMFHMPLFVFVSGYFSRKKDIREFFWNCLKLIEPLIVYQVIMRSYLFLSTGVISIKEILTPWWVLWYLLSLFFWRLLLQILPDKILSRTMLVVASAFIISLIAGFLPLDRMLSLQRTLAFMPFFFMGYSTRGKNLFIAKKYRVYCVLFLILTIAFPIFFSSYLGDLNQADPYETPYRAFSRMLVFGLSIPMSIAFMNICPNTPWIAKQGKLTMQYYIYHAIIIFALMKFVTKFDLPISLLSAVLYTIGIIIVIALFSYFPFFTKLTNPSSFFKKHK